MATLLILGTGVLARAVCLGLATDTERPLHLVVVGRDRARAEEVSFLANSWAAGVKGPVTVAADGADPGAGGELHRLIETHRPAGVVACASAQSPWERRRAPSAWTSLLAEGGFALTIALQASIALRLGRALRAAGSGAWLVNGCFPDAVNPLLAACGLAPLFGLGNVGTLALSLRASLGQAERRQLRVLAHHWHLGQEIPPEWEAVAYLDDQPLPDVGARLAAQRRCDRVELCRVAGLAAAQVLARVATGEEVRASLPGPLGLPGGYPVWARGAELALDLPRGVSAAEAVRRNQEWAARDGAVIEEGRVAFAPGARRALERWLPDRAAGFGAAEIDRVEAEFTALRERLRRLPGR
jgi:hypothetical protein